MGSSFHNYNNRKIIAIWLLLTLLPIIIFFSIMTISEMRKYSKATPYDLLGSSWSSDDPAIYLEINENGGDGYIIVDGEKILAHLETTSGTAATLYALVQNGESYRRGLALLKGDCKFSDDSIIMKISKDYVFNNKYQRIILQRTDQKRFPTP